MPFPGHNPTPPPTLALACAALACAALAAACVDRDEDDAQLQVRGGAILIEDLPELGGDYPDVLIDGLSRQLIDEVNCIEPGVLVEFEIAQEPGKLYTENNIPHMLRPQALVGAEAVAATEGDFLTITSGYRDVGMQYYDYLRGQRFGFLAARPGNSRHQNGQAIDVEDHGFWRQKLIDGGWDWPLGERDRPHFEWPDVGDPDLRTESVRAFQRLWNRNNPDDTIAEDGDFGPMTESKMSVTPAEGFPFGGCDLDLDGFGDPIAGGLDCDDDDPDRNPDAVEICGDGIDQDCSGADLPCDQPEDTGQDATTDTGEDPAIDTGQDAAEPDVPESDADALDTSVEPDVEPDVSEALPDVAMDSDAALPPPPALRVTRTEEGCACSATNSQRPDGLIALIGITAALISLRRLK